MRGGINAASEAGYYSETCMGELVGELAGGIDAVGGGAAGAYDADGVAVAR